MLEQTVFQRFRVEKQIICSRSLFLETQSCYRAQAGLALVILLPPPPEDGVSLQHGSWLPTKQRLPAVVSTRQTLLFITKHKSAWRVREEGEMSLLHE